MTQPLERKALTPLRVIAIYKLGEASLLLIVGVGLLRLVNRDLADVVALWVHRLHLDPDRAFIHSLITQITGLDRQTLTQAGVGTLIYAGLRTLEGYGLWRERRWAEYLTIVATAALLPFEIYEFGSKPSISRFLILLVNAVVVGVLVRQLLRSRRAAVVA